jgi:acyl carrier protein
VSEGARILEFVNARLARNGPVQDTTLDLMGARVVDSMGMLELVVWIEQTFGVRVQNDDLSAANFRSVDTMAAYIRRSLAAQAAR